MSLAYKDDYTNPVTDLLNTALDQMEGAAEMAIEHGYTDQLRRKLDRIFTALNAAEKDANGISKTIEKAEIEHALQMSIVYGALGLLSKYKLTERDHKRVRIARAYARSQMLRRPIVEPFQLPLALEDVA